MIPKPTEQISFSDIQDLVDSQRPEGRDLEYKRDLAGASDADRKEFLADVSSLANAGGGDLIFGVSERAGVPTAASGVAPPDPDAEILRLETMALSGLQPRLIGLRTQWLPDPSNSTRGAIIMRVPASFAAPHRVIFNNWGKFYTRHSRGKQEMDVHELRQVFLASDGLSARLRKFHTDFVESVDRDALQVPLALHVPRAIATVVPLNILREATHLPFTFETAVKVSRLGGFNHLKSLDGFTIYDQGEQQDRSDDVTVSHWRGFVSTTFICGRARDGNPLIWTSLFEKTIGQFVRQSIAQLSTLGMTGPWVIFLSLRNVAGYALAFDNHYASRPIRGAHLDFPEQIAEDSLDEATLRLLELIWLAFGADRPPGLAIGRER